MARQRPSFVTSTLPLDSVLLDPAAFELEIQSHGVTLDHYVSMRCPIGMVDLDDNRRPHPDHSNCSNGFLYKKIGTVRGLLTGNVKRSDLQDVGYLDSSTFQLTVPREYDNPESQLITIAPFDRFFLNEENLVVVYWQVFVHHQSGQDRLNFPVVQVVRLVDNTGREYHNGVEFEIVQGQIRWKPNQAPGIDPDTGKGKICSIRYTYRPYLYVGAVQHDLRVHPQVDPMTGEVKIIRMSQSAQVHREYVFLNEQHDRQAFDSGSVRQSFGPESGSLGPR